MEKPLGERETQLFDKHGLPCGRHRCLGDCKKPEDVPQFICKGDKTYKRVWATRQFQEMT